MPIPFLSLISNGLKDIAMRENLALMRPPTIEPNSAPEPLLQPPYDTPESSVMGDMSPNYGLPLSLPSPQLQEPVISDGIIRRLDLERLLNTMDLSPDAGKPFIETLPMGETKPVNEELPISPEAGKPFIENLPISPEAGKPFVEGMDINPEASKPLVLGETPTEGGKVYYHATTKENANIIRKEGIDRGMVTDTKADAEEYAQMLRNRGNKDVEILELKIPSSQLESMGVVETASGKRVGTRFNVLSPTEGGKVEDKVYYHGGEKLTDIKLGKGKFQKTFYITDDPTYAKSHGGANSVVNEVRLSSDANLADMSKPSESLITDIQNAIAKREAKNVPYSKDSFSFYPYSTKDVIQGIKDGKAHFAELPQIKEILKELGYDGQITSEVGWAKNIGVWNKDVVKLSPTEGGKVENLPKIETLWQPSNKVDAPYEGKFEEGKRYIDSIGEDPYIYETQYIDPKSLLEDLNMEGVSYQGVVDMPTTQKYIEWYKQGKMPPPVGIVKGWNDGKNVSTNRRRIIAAIEAGVEKIPAYIEIGRKSKLSPTEGGKVLTKDEFKNLDFKHPEGGSSKTPKTVMNWKREDYETLLDLAKQEDTFRFDEAIGKNEKFTGIKSSAKLKDKILKNEPIIIYRAVPINEKQTLLPGAYVTESLEYAKRHGDLIIKGGTKEDYEILKETVKPDELMTYGDPHEFIYIPESVDVGYEKYLKASKLSPTEGGKVRTFDTAKGSMLIKTKDGVIHQGRDSMHAIMLERLGISPNDVVDTGIVSNGRAIWLKSKGDKLSPTEGKK